jgi:ATP-dependent helicase/nuclease subunit B
MTAAIYLVTGPPGADLVGPALTEYLRRAREPGAALWLVPSVPSVRAAEAIQRQIAAAARRPVVSPNVYAIDGFSAAILERSGHPPVPSAATRRLVLDDVAAELSRTGRIPYFRRVAETRGFLHAADRLLDELEALGISPEELASAAHGPRAAKLSACAELAAAVYQRTAADGSALNRAVRIVENGCPPPFDRVRTVFISGFTSFTPVEWRLLAALVRQADLWVCLPSDVGDRGDAFAGVSETRARLEVLGRRESCTAPVGDVRPPGLAHLAQHLFGPTVLPATDAAGLQMIEAPGPLGEARLVARRIRLLLAAGTRPDRIVVTARDLMYSLDLLGEVFDEYGLPVELDGERAAARNPAVGALLRAVRLADDGWPFAGVTALLRSTYFRPAWPEATADTVRRAEGLLRLLGEPRDRESYLRAVRLWSETPPDGLEDEGPEESRRRRKARLAAECRPFLERFFRAWDGLPASANPGAFATAVRDFAREIGLDEVAAEDAEDRHALRGLFEAMDGRDGPSVTRAIYLRRLSTLAASVGIPRSQSTAGCVRVVPAEEARHLDCDYLFVLGLGERSFPRLALPPSLLDDADRTILRQAALPFPDPAARLGAEQLLFLELVARPRRELVLSYAAVDEKGQPLLPGSFLRAVTDCFANGAFPVERQRMLIEGYLTREPLSPAEARSRFAQAIRDDGEAPAHPDLPKNVCEQLGWARQAAFGRFRSNDFDRYDGWLDSPAALAVVRERFGPERVFSPTALEAYVSCPFRFLLEHVLRLEELDEPGEEVEHTRRGAAYHRALSRLHTKLREADPKMTRAELPEHVGPELLAEIDRAVAEYAQRAPSPASRRLWELEGKRLHRSAAKYRQHWDGFLDPWRKAGAPLDPHLLEADFGLSANGSDGIAPLIVSVNGIEVRIGGRIDRVDVAALDDGLGFWVIDYKTGRGANYSASELARFEKLQLPLYALAVERVFFPGRKARPLGLAYWLVTDQGPKPVLPGTRQAMGWLSDPKKWATFRRQLEEWVAKVVGRIRDGQFPLAPRSAKCTETCPFGPVCRISQSRNVGKVWELALPTEDDGMLALSPNPKVAK